VQVVGLSLRRDASLGLAIVQEIVQAHGSKISVRGQLGMGRPLQSIRRSRENDFYGLRNTHYHCNPF
jgi:hypothetical protein